MQRASWAGWAWLGVGMKPCALAEKLYGILTDCWQSAVLANVTAAVGKAAGCCAGGLQAWVSAGHGCTLQHGPLELLACSFVLVSC